MSDAVKIEAIHQRINRQLACDPVTIAEVIDLEREFQDKKWGSPKENPHTPAGWFMLIEAELAEAKHALIKGGEKRDSWRMELVQVAALCIAALEQHGVEPPPNQTGREL